MSRPALLRPIRPGRPTTLIAKVSSLLDLFKRALVLIDNPYNSSLLQRLCHSHDRCGVLGEHAIEAAPRLAVRDSSCVAQQAVSRTGASKEDTSSCSQLQAKEATVWTSLIVAPFRLHSFIPSPAILALPFPFLLLN